jgi:hypothetical protein
MWVKTISWRTLQEYLSTDIIRLALYDVKYAESKIRMPLSALLAVLM